MADEISNESKQKFINVNLNSQISAGATVSIKDNAGNVIYEFKTDRTIKTLLYSSASLDSSSYRICADGVGVAYSNTFNMTGVKDGRKNISDTLLVVWLAEIAALALFVGSIFAVKKIKAQKSK